MSCQALKKHRKYSWLNRAKYKNYLTDGCGNACTLLTVRFNPIQHLFVVFLALTPQVRLSELDVCLILLRMARCQACIFREPNAVARVFPSMTTYRACPPRASRKTPCLQINPVHDIVRSVPIIWIAPTNYRTTLLGHTTNQFNCYYNRSGTLPNTSVAPTYLVMARRRVSRCLASTSLQRQTRNSENT